MKLGVIGGGAAGLCFAALACEKHQVTILERMDRVGKRLLATGNGRCNLTNSNMSVSNYHSNQIDFVKRALAKFSVSHTLDFFDFIGVMCQTMPDGKIYPRTMQASSVLDALRLSCAEAGVSEICNFNVTSIVKKDKFIVTSPDKKLVFDKIIVAAGGACAPPLGGGFGGYDLLKKLGHRVTNLTPSLVQIKTEKSFLRALCGIKLNLTATITVGNIKRTEYGECLFTDYGLSGPPILQLSRIAASSPNCFIHLDFMPDISLVDLTALLQQRMQQFPNRTGASLFVGLLNKRLAEQIVKNCPLEPLTLANRIKSTTVKVTGTLAFKDAQCTAGGLDLSQWKDNMESKLVPGLYAIGEILDVDGDCGGYNLQWAWTSAHIASHSISI